MRYISVLLCTIFIVTFTACSNEKMPEPKEANLHPSYTDNNSKENENAKQASIDDILDKIYENNLIEGVEKATREDMENIFGFDMSIIDEYYVRYSAKNYGLADIFVIKTEEKNQQDIFEILTKIKEDRVEQFENYIIYDSLDIAKKSEIYTKGDYVIMIMIKNQDEAKELLDNLLTEEE